MHFCSFCAKNNEEVKEINVCKVRNGNSVVEIKEFLNIFKSDIVKFFLDNKDTFICNDCLKQLKKSYEFVQQMKESINKLHRGKEIKTEHDYSEVKSRDSETKTVSRKVTVDINGIDHNTKSIMFKSNIIFRPILPKTAHAILNDKKKSLNSKIRLYKCLQCTESFKSFKHLNEHEKEFCKNRYGSFINFCKFCHKCYSREYSLNTHYSLKHSQGEFLCCLCQDKVFKAKGFLSRHIQKVHRHESLNFFCGECDDFVCFPTQEGLGEHFMHKHPPEATVEEQSKKAMHDKDMDLEMHEEFLDEFLLAHTNENSFQFPECWEALDLHLSEMLQTSAANLHSGEETTEAFSCPKCHEQFKTSQPLLRHLAEIHDLPVLICRVCNKSFTSYEDFKKHKLQKCLTSSTLHSNTHACPYCSKAFKNASNFKQHLRIVHCQLKKHICQLCDKQFSTLDHLKKHVLSQHQNERKHVCTVCYKNFTQLCHLKQHLAIHTTGKTMECLECNLKFWRKIDLKRHHQKMHIPGSEESLNA